MLNRLFQMIRNLFAPGRSRTNGADCQPPRTKKSILKISGPEGSRTSSGRHPNHLQDPVSAAGKRTEQDKSKPEADLPFFSKSEIQDPEYSTAQLNSAEQPLLPEDTAEENQSDQPEISQQTAMSADQDDLCLPVPDSQIPETAIAAQTSTLEPENTCADGHIAESDERICENHENDLCLPMELQEESANGEDNSVVETASQQKSAPDPSILDETIEAEKAEEKSEEGTHKETKEEISSGTEAEARKEKETSDETQDEEAKAALLLLVRALLMIRHRNRTESPSTNVQKVQPTDSQNRTAEPALAELVLMPEDSGRETIPDKESSFRSRKVLIASLLQVLTSLNRKREEMLSEDTSDFSPASPADPCKSSEPVLPDSSFQHSWYGGCSESSDDSRGTNPSQTGTNQAAAGANEISTGADTDHEDNADSSSSDPVAADTGHDDPAIIPGPDKAANRAEKTKPVQSEKTVLYHAVFNHYHFLPYSWQRMNIEVCLNSGRMDFIQEAKAGKTDWNQWMIRIKQAPHSVSDQMPSDKRKWTNTPWPASGQNQKAGTAGRTAKFTLSAAKRQQGSAEAVPAVELQETEPASRLLLQPEDQILNQKTAASVPLTETEKSDQLEIFPAADSEPVFQSTESVMELDVSGFTQSEETYATEFSCSEPSPSQPVCPDGIIGGIADPSAEEPPISPDSDKRRGPSPETEQTPMTDEPAQHPKQKEVGSNEAEELLLAFETGFDKDMTDLEAADCTSSDPEKPVTGSPVHSEEPKNELSEFTASESGSETAVEDLTEAEFPADSSAAGSEDRSAGPDSEPYDSDENASAVQTDEENDSDLWDEEDSLSAGQDDAITAKDPAEETLSGADQEADGSDKSPAEAQIPAAPVQSSPQKSVKTTTAAPDTDSVISGMTTRKMEFPSPKNVPLYKPRNVDTQKIIGKTLPEWKLPRPILLEGTDIQEAYLQAEERIRTKHLLGMDLLQFAENPAFVRSIHRDAQLSLNRLLSRANSLSASKSRARDVISELNPTAVVLSMALIAFDSRYQELTAKARNVYSLSGDDHQALLKVLRLICEYYKFDEDLVPEFYLRQSIITRANREKFADLMADIYALILGSSIPDNIENILHAVYGEYVSAMNSSEDENDEQSFRTIYQTRVLKEIFITPYWHPELVQYSILFLKYIDALYWKKPLDELPYSTEFSAFFQEWFKSRQTVKPLLRAGKFRRKQGPRWLASYELIYGDDEQIRIALCTRTFYLESGSRPSDYKVIFYAGQKEAAAFNHLSGSIYLKARMLDPVRFIPEDPFAGLGYQLFCKDQMIYSSRTSMHRRLLFFDGDLQEITPQDHIGETVFLAAPSALDLPDTVIYESTDHYQIGEATLSEELLLELNRLLNERSSSETARSGLSSVQTEGQYRKQTEKITLKTALSGTVVPYAGIVHGTHTYPIYSEVHGIVLMEGNPGLGNILLETDGQYRRFAYQLFSSPEGQYYKMISLKGLLKTGFHRIRLLDRHTQAVLASFQLFLDKEARDNSYMVFNPKMQKFSYSNFTELHEEIHGHIDQSASRLISAEVEMDAFEGALMAYYPSPLPFYRIGETGEWRPEKTELSINELDYHDRIYVDGIGTDVIEVISGGKVLQTLPLQETEDHVRYFLASQLLDSIPRSPCSMMLLFRTLTGERDFITVSAFTTARISRFSLLSDLTTGGLTINVHGPHPVRLRLLHNTTEIFVKEGIREKQTIMISGLKLGEPYTCILEGYQDSLFAAGREYLISQKTIRFSAIDSRGVSSCRVVGVYRRKGNQVKGFKLHSSALLLPEKTQLSLTKTVPALLVTDTKSKSSHEYIPVKVKPYKFTENDSICILEFIPDDNTEKVYFSKDDKKVHTARDYQKQWDTLSTAVPVAFAMISMPPSLRERE